MLNILQLLQNVPEWAKVRGLNEESFALLEQISLHPEDKQKILSHCELEVRCSIELALQDAKDKGLFKLSKRTAAGSKVPTVPTNL